VDKARNWFNRAVTLAPDVGEFWAQFYRHRAAWKPKASAV